MPTLEQMRRMLRAGTGSMLEQGRKKNRDDGDLDFVRFEPDSELHVIPPKAPKASTITIRRFECVLKNARKFWEVEKTGPLHIVIFRWGRLGTKGQSTTKTFTSALEADNHIRWKIDEKLGKGYEEVQSPRINSS